MNYKNKDGQKYHTILVSNDEGKTKLYNFSRAIKTYINQLGMHQKKKKL